MQAWHAAVLHLCEELVLQPLHPHLVHWAGRRQVAQVGALERNLRAGGGQGAGRWVSGQSGEPRSMDGQHGTGGLHGTVRPPARRLRRPSHRQQRRDDMHKAAKKASR